MKLKRFCSVDIPLTLDMEPIYSEELSPALISLLKGVQKEKSIKARHEVTVEKVGKSVRMQKIEEIAINDAEFLAALTDRINRWAEFKTKIFAVLQRN